MKLNRFLIIIAGAGFLVGCATTLPNELVRARESYRHASVSVAAKAAPAELHTANLALAKAEKSYLDDGNSYKTRDLAYVAQRKSEIAEATASLLIEQESQEQAKIDYQASQEKIVTNTKEQLTDEQAARLAAEQRADEALAKLAAIKEDARGKVITISGSVLFASNQSTLLPAARSRLDQVAAVLLTTRERNLGIEGHTDSQGSENYNYSLSQRRADTVRNYLVQRGYDGFRIQSRGMGEGQPVANNGSAEGRANNRRVEIIIQRDSHASNQ
ncbi:MAG: OmpA family protein [Pseudomonadota bacterium]